MKNLIDEYVTSAKLSRVPSVLIAASIVCRCARVWGFDIMKDTTLGKDMNLTCLAIYLNLNIYSSVFIKFSEDL